MHYPPPSHTHAGAIVADPSTPPAGPGHGGQGAEGAGHRSERVQEQDQGERTMLGQRKGHKGLMLCRRRRVRGRGMSASFDASETPIYVLLGE